MVDHFPVVGGVNTELSVTHAHSDILTIRTDIDGAAHRTLGVLFSGRIFGNHIALLILKQRDCLNLLMLSDVPDSESRVITDSGDPVLVGED